MVYEGLRQQTLDIDLAIEVDNQYHSEFVAIVRELKNTLSLNIEEASPGDFIPLPANYKERCLFINRYGQLDVFHFDLYSVALSKIERGTGEDFTDVVALLENGYLTMAELTQYFYEILPQFATDSLKQDPDEFQRKFATFTEMWQNVRHKT